MIRVADYVVNFVHDVLKVKDVFMLSGGGIMYLTDALAQNNDINTVCVHHEQTASMAIEAYSRITENFGVGFFTTGPGATNAITGLVGAWQDSVPCFFISGQSKRQETIHNSGVDNLRQFGVQEVNIIPIVKSVTKYAVLLDDPKNIRYELEKMLYISKSGRPGPVWLDIPLDVQGALIDPCNLESFSPPIAEIIKLDPAHEELMELKKMLEASRRPVIVAGQGIRIAKALDKFKDLIEKFNIPVVTTYLGIDVLASDHSLNIGRMGIKGTRAGNFAVQNADLVIVIGSSLHVGSIGYEYNLFAREAKKVIVDIDKTAHLKKTIDIDLYINADAEKFINAIMNIEDFDLSFDDKWVQTCSRWKMSYPVCLLEYADQKQKINIYYFIDKLNHYFLKDEIIIGDAGSVYYAVAQGIQVSNKNRYITSGALATMGYTLPATIGAAIASGKRVIGITGDGSFQLNIQELQTIIYYKLPIKLFVLNNNGYISIRFTQERFFEKRFIGEGAESGLSFPDLQKISDAYGIKFYQIKNQCELDKVINLVLLDDGPVICEVMISCDQPIIPTVQSVKNSNNIMVSKPLEDMYPFLDRKEFYSNMFIKPLQE